MFFVPVINFGAGSGYTGPGDLVPGATGWWGLRAYSAAKIGTNIVRLRESGGDTEQDFAAIAGGGLDLVAIAAFKGANNLFVTKLYDQAGSHDAYQTVAVNQPAFTLSAIGSLPSTNFIRVTNDARLVTDTPAGFTVPTPFTLSTVVRRTNVGGEDAIFGGAVGDVEWRISSGNVLQLLKENIALLDTGPAVSDATWLSLATTYDAVNVAFYVNGTSSSGGADATGVAAVGPYWIGRASGNAEQFNGFISEFGTWGSIFSEAEGTSMAANQQAYWGF